MIIDWNTIANITTAAATLGLVAAAWFGLRTWRKELIGKKKIDLAGQIMESVCDIRDLLFFVRSTNTGRTVVEYVEILEELKKAKDRFNEGAEIYQDKLHYLLPFHRLNQSIDEINNFLKIQNKAQLYWDDNIEKLFKELHFYLLRVREASNMLYNSPEPEKHQEMIRLIWDNTQKDEISKRIEDIVKEFRFNLEPLYKDQRIKWKKIRA
ncbi:MAG: hypothetical protein FWF01_03370 [Alphaproteobacteria bacterium]|nr:hypothetical protein [Alphaproteobacteria bacterium]